MTNVWRPSPNEVERLRGPIDLREDYTLAMKASRKLRGLLARSVHTHALGAVTGNQAMQMVKAGVPAIYCSGWQVAADANDSLHMYPDQSLYSVNSVPMLVRRINNSLKRAAQIQWTKTYEDEEGWADVAKWLCPIVADAEAGFGGPLNAFELMKAMIEAGAAGVHFEDQLSSAKKCGHMGGKVLVPASEFIRKLKAARLAAEVCGVDTVIVARTDANAARLLTSNYDDADGEFLAYKDGEKLDTRRHFYEELLSMGYSHNGALRTMSNGHRTPEGFYHITGGIDMAINRGLQYAPFADMLWCETSVPDLDEAKKFAEGIHKEFPDKMLAYNCSPSFNWKENLDDATIARFQTELNAMGYKFQFITLAGFHSLNMAMFDLAREYEQKDMSAYASLQTREFAEEEYGYTAHRHQAEVGTGYYDLISQTIDEDSSTLAMRNSTEKEQF